MVMIASWIPYACLALGSAPESYAAALTRAKQDKRPLLVLVGATWCPACQVMERQVLPRLMQHKSMAGVSVAKVDTDREPTLAQQLMRGNAIPQIIVFSQRPDGSWYREQITGAASEAAVRSLVERASDAQNAAPAGHAGHGIGH